MRRLLAALLTAAFVAGAAAPAFAGPKEVVEWLKDPCVPTGDLENDCRLPNPF